MASPFSYTPARDDSAKLFRWGRIVLTIVLALLARSAFRSEYGRIALVGDVDVAIHEFGHYLFLPFGRTMNILGGSLFQVIFPLIFMAYFLRPTKRDVHAAMVCLWWASLNLLDVSVYAADARAGRLMLLNGLTGQESDAHDWYNLFEHWGLLNRDTIIAARMRALAGLTCTASILVGLYVAWFADPPTPAIEEPATV